MRVSPLRRFLEEHRLRELSRRTPVVPAEARPGAAVGRVETDPGPGDGGGGVHYLPYGVTDETPRGVCELIGTLGRVETEYAAIRRGAGVLDSPHRGTLEITGADRIDFLNRMLTAELKDLADGAARASFWLNRKGRIDADLLLVDSGDRTLVDVDLHQVATTMATLDEFLFAEDVQIADAGDRYHRIVVHGPAAEEVVAGLGPAVVRARHDQVGDPGVHLFVPMDAAVEVAERLLADREWVRAVGWFAFNTARIEAGTVLLNVDFGPDNLPHETGLVEERISFTKGCYLGQEIVARLHNLGRPKQLLRGLRVAGDTLPMEGDPVRAAAGDDVVGAVTSSTLSPMLGAAPIAFAMLRSDHADDGAVVRVGSVESHVDATVGPLRMWSRG